MKTAIDSYCYHRFFGEVYPQQTAPSRRMTAEDFLRRAYELGANAYMIKPMDLRAVEHLFSSITHYWGLECAKPELEFA